MEFLILLALTIPAGSICGIVAVVMLRRQRQELDELRRKVARLEFSKPVADTRPAPERPEAPAARRMEPHPREKRADPAPRTVPEEPAASAPRPAPRQPAPAEEAAPPPKEREPSPIDWLVDNIRDQWMVWLGGLCVALAGIFLVRYSIEIGLLGPLGRIVAGLLVGTGLLAGGEWLRRRTGSYHPAFAALAGAGSITLYASIYAAVRLYGLIEPATAFVPMALVAIGTMAMALIHGPVLAAFGILGAYLVPILLSSGSGQILVALAYALIVSASALLLMRYVYRPWLWWGFLAGALGWWLLSLDPSGADGFRTLYLCALGYMISALPWSDWLLQRPTSVPAGSGLRSFLSAADSRDRHHAVGYFLLALALGITIATNADAGVPWAFGLPFLVLSFFLARRQETLTWLPWLVLMVVAGGWLLSFVDISEAGFDLAQVADEQRVSFLLYLLGTAIIATGLAIMNLGGGRRPAAWASLASLAPMLMAGLGYLLVAYQRVDWQWGIGTALVSLAYLALAAGPVRKRSIDSMVVWLFIGAHLGLALAAAMAFDSASLTLAIAAQIVSLAWIIRRFELPDLGWLLKLVVTAVILRLTFNPWLPDYPTGVHWSLWTYGGSALLAAAGTILLRAYPRISQWAEGATLHLLVLTIWSEVRYQLYDGAVYAAEFTLTEAAVNVLLFGLLGIVYYRRSKVSQTLAAVYRLYSWALLLAAGLQYGSILANTAFSEPWAYSAIGTTPILNKMLLAFGAPVAVAWLCSRFYDPAWRRYALAVAALSAFAFVSLEIRHLWAGTIRLDFPAIASGELYTYSATWLAIAIVAVLGGTVRWGQDVYRAGMLLLALVIGKLFLVDLSDLEGLLRVASFMGLGLSLLGISYLHQRLKDASAKAS